MRSAFANGSRERLLAPKFMAPDSSLPLEYVDETAMAQQEGPESDIADLPLFTPSLPPMGFTIPQAGTPSYASPYSTYMPEQVPTAASQEARRLTKSSLQFILDGTADSGGS